jgi:exopolyphosphatase/guanosine-5'-triphosphate,3'-diphosphate pyrophosphatase
MAKITTIIDIGSNSMRMVVIKKTSRFGFYILNETKSKVQILQEFMRVMVGFFIH